MATAPLRSHAALKVIRLGKRSYASCWALQEQARFLRKAFRLDFCVEEARREMRLSLSASVACGAVYRRLGFSAGYALDGILCIWTHEDRRKRSRMCDSLDGTPCQRPTNSLSNKLACCMSSRALPTRDCTTAALYLSFLCPVCEKFPQSSVLQELRWSV